MSLDDAPPKDLYLHWIRATGMTLQEMAQMPQHIKDIQDGLQYRNDDLQIKGINGLLGPTYLKRGIGRPEITAARSRKKSVRLVPARDANGVDHPDKVYRFCVSTPIRWDRMGNRCTTTRDDARRHDR